MKTIHILIMLLAVSSAAMAETITAKLVAGYVTLTRGGETRALRVGDEIRMGDKVTTAASSFAALRGEDGSVYKLAADTVFDAKTLNSTSAGRQQHFEVTKGKLLANIARLSKSSDVTFATPSAVAGVRGTVLVLEVTPEGTRLYVLKGSVAVGKPGAPPQQNVGENQRADVRPNVTITVKPMTEGDQQSAATGIPVRVTLELGNGQGGSRSEELRGELRSGTSAQQGRVSQGLQQNQQRVAWDIESGRTVRVGEDLFQVSQRFRKADANTIVMMNVMDNRTKDRITVFEARTVWNTGIPSLSSLLAASGDVSSLVVPSRSDLSFATKEGQKRGDLLEIAMTKNGGSLDQSYRVNAGEWYSGSRIGSVNEAGRNYLVLKNATGGEDYRFETQFKMVDASTGAETTLNLSGSSSGSLTSLFGSLGNTSIYAALVLSPGSLKSSTFTSERMELIVTAEHLGKIVVNLLTQI